MGGLDSARPRSAVDEHDLHRALIAHLDALYRTARRIVGDPEAARDLVQDTCVKAYRAREQWARVNDPRSWLFTILVNAARDYRRHLRRAPFVASEEPSPGERAVAGTETPEEVTERRDLDRRLMQAVAALSPDLRLVLFMADGEGMSYEVIGHALAWPLGTVASRLYRARATVRERLARLGLVPAARAREGSGRVVRLRRPPRGESDPAE